MMQPHRANFLTGQIYGKVDWVSRDKREAGLYIRTSGSSTTRCVLVGEQVETLLAAPGALEEGMMVTASGLLYARCAAKPLPNGNFHAEVLCQVDRLTAESGSSVRVRGAVYACLKGVAMYWHAESGSVKTFFNFPNKPGMPAKMVTSLYLTNWLAGLAPIKKERFLAAMRVGREYTCAGITEASAYVDKQGNLVPVLTLLPLDFKLQG